MEIVEISHNDSLRSVAQKCNLNFKQLAFSTRESIQRQGRSSDITAEAIVSSAVSELTNVTIPEEVASQISNLDIQGQIDSAITAQDIPSQVSTEISRQLSAAYPPIGSCLLAYVDPAGSYPGTTWQQTDSITMDSSAVISLWERTA